VGLDALDGVVEDGTQIDAGLEVAPAAFGFEQRLVGFGDLDCGEAVV
jgi:hypothetical protein